MNDVKRFQGEDNRLLLGLTGGIATGKSTVAGMLREMGAYLIDLDVIAREVVEPEKPAWKDIVEFFGKHVLQADKNIDRKKLADIVFKDIEKRKKLESCTHPRILEELVRQINEIAGRDSDAIIGVDVPLLIELNLQDIFHKVLVVYASQTTQIERLMKRDVIKREEAENRLKAQLPIDAKVGYGDFVIKNDQSIEDTRQQVEKVWKALRKIKKKEQGEGRRRNKESRQ